MEICIAQSRDIPGMIELLKQVGEVHHQIRPDIFRSGALKYDEHALQELLLDNNRPIFVAEEDGFVQGYCFCIHRSYNGDGALTDRKELYIDDLCVDEACRGRGVATALYRHVCDYAKKQGCAFITLNVWRGNDRAQRFYEHMGMTPRSFHMEMPLEDN